MSGQLKLLPLGRLSFLSLHATSCNELASYDKAVTCKCRGHRGVPYHLVWPSVSQQSQVSTQFTKHSGRGGHGSLDSEFQVQRETLPQK